MYHQHHSINHCNCHPDVVCAQHVAQYHGDQCTFNHDWHQHLPEAVYRGIKYAHHLLYDHPVVRPKSAAPSIPINERAPPAANNHSRSLAGTHTSNTHHMSHSGTHTSNTHPTLHSNGQLGTYEAQNHDQFDQSSVGGRGRGRPRTSNSQDLEKKILIILSNVRPHGIHTYTNSRRELTNSHAVSTLVGTGLNLHRSRMYPLHPIPPHTYMTVRWQGNYRA